MTSVNHYF